MREIARNISRTLIIAALAVAPAACPDNDLENEVDNIGAVAARDAGDELASMGDSAPQD